MGLPSLDAVGALEFADVGDDRRYVAARQPLDRRHVPETPVMGPDAACDRALERLVAMVAGLIDDMHQRWGDPVLSRRVSAVAGRAAGCVSLLPALRLCRESCRHVHRDDRQPAAAAVEIDIPRDADSRSQDGGDRGSFQ